MDSQRAHYGGKNAEDKPHSSLQTDSSSSELLTTKTPNATIV
jgi:hypothetical protein